MSVHKNLDNIYKSNHRANESQSSYKSTSFVKKNKKNQSTSK
jgi:hypothetical protein